MHTRINTALFIAILTINQELVKAEEGADPGVGQRITSSAKSIGTKIVEGVKKLKPREMAQREFASWFKPGVGASG